MKRNNETQEIISFINASFMSLCEVDSTTCINRLTQIIEEEFLMNRAELIINSSLNDLEMQKALKKLSSICNDKEMNCDKCPVTKYCNSFIANERSKVNKDSPKMVDLFCGAGGLSLGFSQEGFITSLANDIQECCIDTYAHNHPETPRKYIVLGDIEEVVGKIENLLRYKDVDIVVGGPPCQGFSVANRQRLIDDPRNQLYRNFVKVVDKIKPPFFVMENVKGMLSVAGEVIEDFRKIGYSVKSRVLNAKDFGVPQNRERLIYIGNRMGIDVDLVFEDILKESKRIPTSTLGDALYGLRQLSASTDKNSTEVDSFESGFKIEKAQDIKSTPYLDLINQNKSCFIVCNHKARYNNNRDIEIYRRLLPGDKSDDPKIADIMPYIKRNDIFKDKYYKLEPNKVCKTITAHMRFDCNMYIHPTQARGLTPREAARIQSYPDDFFFRGVYTKTYMQIGNSVPPLLGRVIAKVIKKYL